MSSVGSAITSSSSRQAWPNLGLRFSLNDEVASLWSVVSKVTCSSAIDASSSMFTRSLTIWLIESLVQRIAQVGPFERLGSQVGGEGTGRQAGGGEAHAVYRDTGALG